MNRFLTGAMWVAISLAGAGAFGYIAVERGETISAAWLVVAAVCTYLVAYRFYSRFIAEKVFELDPKRATPAERLNNGRDFVPTNRWILFGHHFSAISGAGTARRSDIRGAVWFSSWNDLAHRRRRARRRGAGLPDPLRVDAAGWQVARSDREGRSESGRRSWRRWSRSSRS